MFKQHPTLHFKGNNTELPNHTLKKLNFCLIYLVHYTNVVSFLLTLFITLKWCYFIPVYFVHTNVGSSILLTLFITLMWCQFIFTVFVHYIKLDYQTVSHYLYAADCFTLKFKHTSCKATLKTRFN